MKTDELVKDMDWRWRLLLCLAILLITLDLHKRPESRAETNSNMPVTSQSWQELDLRWEPEGRLGQGIYANGGQDARLSTATMIVREGTVGESRLEPRLAVFTARPLDLNRIDVDTLRILKGIGPKMATAIIAHRQNHGPFRRIEELLEVKGVGPAKFKELSRNLAVEASGHS